MSIPHPSGPPRMMVLHPAHLRGQTLDLRTENVLVGRDPNSHLVLDDPHVSRTHAAIHRTGDYVVLEDLHSSAGTKVNGISLVGSTPLRDGDVVDFATVAVRYEAAAHRTAETQMLPAQPPPVGPMIAAGARFDIGPQQAGVISNIGRDQYNSYVHHRESFVREIAAAKSTARFLIWLGFFITIAGFVAYGAMIVRFIAELASTSDLASTSSGPEPMFPPLFGPEILGTPIGIIGLGASVVGMVILIVGIVGHVVATSRSRRADREMPLPFPRPY